MNKLTALIEAAKAATPGPWKYYKHDNFLESESSKSRISDWPVTRSTDVGTYQRNKNATFIALANPTTILELCALLEKAKEALQNADQIIRFEGCHYYLLGIENRDEAITAIKQWKEQT